MSDYTKILDLLSKRDATDSIRERDELNNEINKQCFLLLIDIAAIENKIQPNYSLLLTINHWNPTYSSDYDRYDCHVNNDTSELYVEHYYIFRGESQTDEIIIPLSCLSDMEKNVAKVHEYRTKKYNHDRQQAIINDLIQLKTRIQEYDVVDDQYNEIFTHNFWNLIP